MRFVAASDRTESGRFLAKASLRLSAGRRAAASRSSRRPCRSTAPSGWTGLAAHGGAEAEPAVAELHPGGVARPNTADAVYPI